MLTASVVALGVLIANRPGPESPEMVVPPASPPSATYQVPQELYDEWVRYEVPDSVLETEPEPEPESTEPQVVETLYGNCRITAYCSCVKCCGEYALNRPVDENGNQIVYGAAGVALTPGVSVACPLPIGTKLHIPALGDTEYIVQDRTAQWVVDKYDGMIVDVYFADHDACYEWFDTHGQDYADVYIVEEEVQ